MIRIFHSKAVILLIIIVLGAAITGCTSSPAAIPASTPGPAPAMVVTTTMASAADTAMTMSLPSTSAPFPSATVPPATNVPVSSGNGQTVVVTLISENFLFDQKTITAPAGSNVVMTFINKDASVPHNFALYTDSTATKKIFSGNIITGPATVTYSFTAPSAPGNYFFRCDVHPTVMFGTFVVT